MGHICHIKCIWHVSTNVKLFGVISSLYLYSKKIPTDPWNIPQTLNQLSFLRKSFHICILGYLDVPAMGYNPGVCWNFLRYIHNFLRFAVTTICSNSLQHSTGTFYTVRVGRLARYLIEQYGKCKSIRGSCQSCSSMFSQVPQKCGLNTNIGGTFTTPAELVSWKFRLLCVYSVLRKR